MSSVKVGKVHLVGAGPGDPELLTLRAARLLQSAEVVVHDHLVGPGVLDLISPAAERIYVGKQKSRHSMVQGDINALLVRLAREGKEVVRLKGGDPFIFGRGGEELQVLAAAGIPFDVVPGVTAASGVACFAGIPLTHRDHAQACVWVTGHLKAGTDGGIDWPALARPRQTLVIYMGLAELPGICAHLIEHGAPASRAAAVVERATLPQQRVVTGTLADLPERVADAGLQSPSLVIVGEVVRLRDELAWFDGSADAVADVPSTGG
jgi:uroporphyrin-III C-methyltransferase/precorrin-2 dehydrogenase/sirohydrochlorin ferrochelatase